MHNLTLMLTLTLFTYLINTYIRGRERSPMSLHTRLVASRCDREPRGLLPPN